MTEREHICPAVRPLAVVPHGFGAVALLEGPNDDLQRGLAESLPNVRWMSAHEGAPGGLVRPIDLPMKWPTRRQMLLPQRRASRRKFSRWSR